MWRLGDGGRTWLVSRMGCVSAAWTTLMAIDHESACRTTIATDPTATLTTIIITLTATMTTTNSTATTVDHGHLQAVCMG